MRIWQELVSAAIVGTERQKPQFSAVESNELQQILRRIESGDAESALLQAAAICALWRKAGTGLLIDKQNAAAEVCAPETQLQIGENAAWVLRRIDEHRHSKLLRSEFLALAAAKRQLISPRLLPKLFWQARQDENLRLELLPLAGRRGCWLARQNSDWQWVLIAENAVETWEVGKFAERLLALRWQRWTNTDQAREMLAATWQIESAKDRAEFVKTLKINLSESDRRFLESVWSLEKADETRRQIAELLTSLPNSAAAQQATEIARRAFVLEEQKSPASKNRFAAIEIVESFPDWANDQALKDFFSLSDAAIKQLGDRKDWLIAQIVEAIPLEFWSEKFGLSPDEVFAAATRGSRKRELLRGLCAAARQQRNRLWTRLLLRRAAQDNSFGESEKPDYHIFSNLIREQAANLLDAAPAVWVEELISESIANRSRSFGSEHPARWLLYFYRGAWSDSLTTIFVELIKDVLASDKVAATVSNVDYGTANLIESAALRIPARSIEKVVRELRVDREIHRYFREKLDVLFEVLELRRQIHQAFESEK